MRFETGDIVTPIRSVEGLDKGKPYEIVGVRRGIDGAYDYDDIEIKGYATRFCEFDFDIWKE